MSGLDVISSHRLRRIVFRPARRVIALVVLLALSGIGCSPRTSQFEYFRITINDQSTLGVSVKSAIIRGAVIFFHSRGTNEFEMTSDAAHRDLVGALADSGFAVVASSARGDAWGNAESQRDYLELVEAVTRKYRVENVYFLAEGMGALPAVNVMAMGPTSRLRGMAAINPILSIAAADAAHHAEVMSAYGSADPATSDPMAIPVDKLAGRRVQFYVDQKSEISTDANALAFQRRFGKSADISIVDCSDGGGGTSCFDGHSIVKWFIELEKRT